MSALWAAAFALVVVGLMLLGSGARRAGAQFGWAMGAALAWLTVAGGSVPLADPAWQVDVMAVGGIRSVFATPAVDAAGWHWGAGVLLMVLATAGLLNHGARRFSSRLGAAAWLLLAGLGLAGVLPLMPDHLVALPLGERLGTTANEWAGGGWSTQAALAFGLVGFGLLASERIPLVSPDASSRLSRVPWVGLGGALLVAAGLVWRLQAAQLGLTAHESGATMLALPLGLLVVGTQLVRRTGGATPVRAPLDEAVRVGAVAALSFLLVSWGAGG